MQFLFIIFIICTSLLKISFAAATFFTQVTIDHNVLEFGMEYGGTHVVYIGRGLFGYSVPADSFQVAYSDNENVKCFLRGYVSGDKGRKGTVSALSRYGSPVYMKKTRLTKYNQLVCYDISDNPDTVVLLLDTRGNEFRPSLDVLHKLPLDEKREGVLLFPNDKQYFGLVAMIESPYEELWCKAGDTYLHAETLGYGGAKRISDVTLNALPCTTKPGPVGDFGPPGILPDYNPNQPNYLAMDEYFNNLIETEKRKTTTTNSDDPDTVRPDAVLPSFIYVD